MKFRHPNLNGIAHNLHIDINKSFKKELYRKSIHLSSLWIPALIYFLHPGLSIIIFSTLFVGDALLEYGN